MPPIGTNAYQIANAVEESIILYRASLDCVVISPNDKVQLLGNFFFEVIQISQDDPT